jgi:putative transposase
VAHTLAKKYGAWQCFSLFRHRQTIFFSDHDKVVHFQMLKDCLSRDGLATPGFCLIDRHSHHALIPEMEDSISTRIGRLHNDYARWQNIQCGRRGHLWEKRFYSCPVEDGRVWGVLRYIELNPVRAGLVEHAWDWKWSSARAHVTGTDESGVLDMDHWRRAFSPAEWKSYLEKAAAELKSLHGEIRKATASGRLLGSEVTARRLELALGRPVLPRRPGRKPRQSG